MTYIGGEVLVACRQRGLGCQLRRKWTVREKPVSASSVEDYEWKLIPGEKGNLPDEAPGEIYEGHYYLLGLDRAGGKFIFHHDTRWGGDGSEMNLATFTEIGILALDNPGYFPVWRETPSAETAARMAPPPPGWLCKTLVLLIERFQPNSFSIS